MLILHAVSLATPLVVCFVVSYVPVVAFRPADNAAFYGGSGQIFCVGGAEAGAMGFAACGEGVDDPTTPIPTNSLPQEHRLMVHTDRKTLTILVVEDDAATRQLIAKIVASAGYSVFAAANGRLALDDICKTRPDLIICDWDMPEMDGLELCRHIRRGGLSQYVYFLLLTSKSGTDDLVEALAVGANEFISKPISKAVLLARIQSAFRLLCMERELRRLSHCDALTDVLNRRAFHEHLVREWQRENRRDGELSCVMVDLDFFKRINDTHGHAVGDAMLAAVASCLKGQCRASDILCRYGGEEFCVILPETNEDQASSWAKRAQSAISAATVPVGGVSLHVSASLGVAERHIDMRNPEELVSAADQALAVAKQLGRDRIVRFSLLNERLPDLAGSAQSEGPLRNMLARDIMSVAVFCPSEDDTIQHVTDIFLQLRINSAPVVKRDGTVAGIVAEADLLTRTALGEGWEDKVHEVMRADVVCYEEDTSLECIYRFLSRVAVPRIVVVQAGRPTGVISRATLLRWFRCWKETYSCGHLKPSRWSDRSHAQRKAGIAKTAEMVARLAAEIPRRIPEETSDCFPGVLAEATRLQSLASDLLGYCRGSYVP